MTELDTDTEETIKVFVRTKPLAKKESSEWKVTETSVLDETNKAAFNFDKCFGSAVKNKEIYDQVGRPVVIKALDGFNGTIFCYGQTQAGKTYTMHGDESDPGIMVHCVQDLLGRASKSAEFNYYFKVSYIEVYKEVINDMLGVPGSTSKNLKIISEDTFRGVTIGGLVEEYVETYKNFEDAITRGNQKRAKNAQNFISHGIFRVTIEAIDKKAETRRRSVEEVSKSKNSILQRSGRISYLNFVDLAGSEKQHKPSVKFDEPTTKTKQSAAVDHNINSNNTNNSSNSTGNSNSNNKDGHLETKSLDVLEDVMRKLSNLSQKQIKSKPDLFYIVNNSKLTRILKQSLGGNAITTFICNISLSTGDKEETLKTLKFGQLCKGIRHNVKVNDEDEKALIIQYRNTIKNLQNQVDELTTTLLVGDTNNNNRKSDQPAPKLKEYEDKIISQQKTIQTLQKILEDQQDFQETKQHFEIYEHYTRQELEEEHNKLEREKQSLHGERLKLLKDRSAIDEKEARIGLLVTNLDERESKLRQITDHLREQQDRWQRNIADLESREELIKEWNIQYQQREMTMNELMEKHKIKMNDLNTRELLLAEQQKQLLLQQKECQDHEHTLSNQAKRLTLSEQNLFEYEQRLNQFDTDLKKRSNLYDTQEQEVNNKKKEIGNYELLIKEKEKKLLNEQRMLDEREQACRTQEQILQERNRDSDKRQNELRQKEHTMQNKLDHVMLLQMELNLREKELQEQNQLLQTSKEEMTEREHDFKRWESRLSKLQEKCNDIDQHERDLEYRILQHQKVEEEFYKITQVQMIQQHQREMNALEQIITSQLKAMMDICHDMEVCKYDLAQKQEQIKIYEGAEISSNKMIDDLKLHIKHLENQMKIK